MVVGKVCAVDAFLKCMKDQIVTDGHIINIREINRKLC